MSGMDVQGVEVRVCAIQYPKKTLERTGVHPILVLLTLTKEQKRERQEETKGT